MFRLRSYLLFLIKTYKQNIGSLSSCPNEFKWMRARQLGWIIAAFSRRWSIEVAFKSSKQVMKIQAPQHWCQESVEKLSPWVWLMQSVIGLWYIAEGCQLPAARTARRRFGEWDTEWSLVHMLRILRTAILADTINPKSATKADLHQLLDHLENYLHLAT